MRVKNLDSENWTCVVNESSWHYGDFLPINYLYLASRIHTAVSRELVLNMNKLYP